MDQTDLIIDLRTGEVKSMIIPYGSRWFRLKLIVIPWRVSTRLESDLIIVDLTTEDYAAVMKKIQEVPRWNKPPFWVS